MNLQRFLLSRNLSGQIYSQYSTLLTSRNTLGKCNTSWTSALNIKIVNFQLPTSFVHRTVATIEEKPVRRWSFLTKLINKIPFLNIDRNRLNVAGFMLYESIADDINYEDFIDEFLLPDTFYTWFAVTELHIWMLLVRAMAEGEDGRFVRNSVVQALWGDVGLRVKKVGAMNPAGMRMQIAELSEQFQAALIAYDEGLQSNDTVLAGALWRRLYQQNEVDPEHLDLLVKYIRRQIRVLDNITREDLFSQKPVTWGSIV